MTQAVFEFGLFPGTSLIGRASEGNGIGLEDANCDVDGVAVVVDVIPKLFGVLLLLLLLLSSGTELSVSFF